MIEKSIFVGIIQVMGKKRYQQIKDEIKAELRSGRFAAGDFFHTEKELMKIYSASYATVSHAMKDLAGIGIFERTRGYGTTIKCIPPLTAGNLTGEVLYISGIKTALQPRKASPISWFVYDKIQKGIINTWPGPVQIRELEEIGEIAEKNKDIKAVFLSPLMNFIEKLYEMQPMTYTVVDLRRDLSIDFNAVAVETTMGVYNLMSYLIKELKHERIALLGGDRKDFHADRYAGYRLALDANIIPFREEYCIRGLASKEDAYNAMKRLLRLPKPPTAVFADTDIKALGAMEAAMDLKFKIPEDVSIAGFDDAPGTENFTPPLTTLRIPYTEIGEEATRMLIDRIASKGADLPIKIVTGKIIKRQSCARIREER